MGQGIVERVQDLLGDVDYPAGKDSLLAEAERRGADEDALRALRALPPVDYGNEQEVLRSLGIHPAEHVGGERSDKGPQRREHTHRGLAEHMKDTERPPVEQETGENRGS